MERVVFACRLPDDRRKSILGQRGGEHLYSPPVNACMQENSTMRLCTIGLVATLALLVAPLAAQAPQRAKVPKVGWLSDGLRGSTTSSLHEAFLHALRDLGYVEGQNLVMERRDAEGNLARLPGLAAQRVGLKVDVIVTLGVPGTRAAMQATTTIPIVMAE